MCFAIIQGNLYRQRGICNSGQNSALFTARRLMLCSWKLDVRVQSVFKMCAMDFMMSSFREGSVTSAGSCISVGVNKERCFMLKESGDPYLSASCHRKNKQLEMRVIGH